MSIFIKEEPTIDTTQTLVSIPVHEPGSEYFPPASELVPFCSLCIRECPANGDLFEFNVESSSNFCHSIKELLGIEHSVQSFNSCKTCWKMVRMIGDFRKCCIQAQSWMEQTDGVGLKSADEWNSEATGQTIDYLQEAIESHTKRIEQAEPDEAELVTMMSFEQFKVQACEVKEVVQKENSMVTEADSGEKMLEQVAPSDELLLNVSAHRKSEEKIFHCRLCDIAFNRIDHFRRHKQTIVHQHRVKILNKLSNTITSKSDCNTKTPESITSYDDLLEVKSVEKSYSEMADKIIYKCEECDTIFKEGHQLRMHKLTIKHQKVVEMYKEAIVKIADINNETCDDDDNERKEIPKRPKTKQKASTTRKHKCPKCGARMASKGSLRIHLNFVHAEARFECDHCGDKFKKKDGMKRHMFKQHIAKRDSICPVCSKRFMDASALQGHLSSHKGYRPFECDQCDKGYHNKKLLDAHVQKWHSL